MLSAVTREKSPIAMKKDECWSMDFVIDQLYDNRRIRALTIVDNFSRECLNITLNYSIKGEDVVNVMHSMYRQ
jgi:putative transposase